MHNEVEEKLQALSARYAKELPNKVKDMQKDWLNFKRKPDAMLLNELIRQAHTLCGTSGTYGYTQVSQEARKLEVQFQKLLSEPAHHFEAKVDNMLADLNQLILHTREEKIIPSLNLNFETTTDRRDIYLLETNLESVTNEFEQIIQFNYKVKFFNDVALFLKAVSQHSPNMVIMAIQLAEKIPLKEIKKLHDDMSIIVFTDAQDNLASRLFTVRHFGQAFIGKPFEVATLLHTIDNLFEAKQFHDEHILIVDDSEALANYYATILNHAGMITQQVSDTKFFLSVLQEFQPDLILMDINMPYCNGSELAQVVHQQESFSGIPIIFLSTIAERTKQLEVLSVAGDDFLTKPIDPKHLLAAVRNRLMRSHILRSRMARDSLTNLYNHTMIHQHLDREIIIAERHQRPLSVVLFDIDHFKAVNDTYGHQAGDKVLKDLSMFLQKYLRKSDLIGRYGGEEFLVILPQTAVDEAVKIVEALRVKFAETPHTLDDVNIFVTLSGGISNYPTFKTVGSLVKVADNALYEAKQTGRNRIVVGI
ncbi:MAG: diguanylate cyclase [Gammaproteobacteria bacterium]|nr:diguanylate cyclase [Gammaproteobacteria bacterium]